MNGQIIQDAFFDFFQAIVIIIQDFLRLFDVHIIFRLVAPGKLQQPVNIVANDIVFGIHAAHAIEAVDFPLYNLADFIGVIPLSQLFSGIFNIRSLAIFVSQLFANRLDLLPQIVILLDFIHLLADFASDFMLKL